MHSRRRVIPNALQLQLDDDGGGDLSLGARALQLSPTLPVHVNIQPASAGLQRSSGGNSSTSQHTTYMLKRSASQGHAGATLGTSSTASATAAPRSTAASPLVPPSHHHHIAARPVAGHRRRQTLTRANELPTAVLPTEVLDRIHAVIDSICIVRFDLDTGPEFDNCYPPCDYSARERSHIAFSSFPDHTEKGNSTTTFSWKMPRLREDGVTPRASHEQLYGYVYFSQEKDNSIRRGYAQRSLAIVTRLPGLPGLFTRMVNVLGPMYFNAKQGHNSSVVETALHNIYKWPPLKPGTTEIAFLGHIMLVEIPLPHQAQFQIPRISSSNINTSGIHSSALANNNNNTSPKTHLRPSLSLPPPPLSPASIPVLAGIPAVPLSQLLRETINQLWLIWELVVLAEPILVYSADPSRSSEVVQWLLSIIKPLPFAGDYRPFFHIHTPDFAVILNNNKPRAGTLIGATNPLILSGARHYPHIIRLSPPKLTSDTNSPVQGVFGSVARSAASQSFKDAQHTAHGLFSERKRHVKKDTVALKAAEDKLRAFDFAGADAILLQSMSTLTERFLVPLNRYFATLLPADVSNGMSTPRQTSNFSQSAFLQSLKTHGTPLPFRRSKMPSMNMSAHNDVTATATAVAFYEHFMRSPNFLTWLRSRSEQTQHTTRARYLHQLETGDTDAYLRGKTDAEMEDLQKRLEREARLTQEEIEATPLMVRQRSQSHDVTATSRGAPFADDRSTKELMQRNHRLIAQVQRVKAMRQATHESDDSDASSIPSVA